MSLCCEYELIWTYNASILKSYTSNSLCLLLQSLNSAKSYIMNSAGTSLIISSDIQAFIEV